MSELKTYRAREAGYVDDGFVEEGAVFTTAKPKGRWMALLDDKGSELPDPEPEPAVDANALAIEEGIAAARQEISDKAKQIIDDMRTDFEGKLKAETARADAAEKLLGDADAATDKAVQRAEAAEKEVEALKAEIEKAKTPAAKAK